MFAALTERTREKPVCLRRPVTFGGQSGFAWPVFASQRPVPLLGQNSRWTLKNEDPLSADEDNVVRQRSAVLREDRDR